MLYVPIATCITVLRYFRNSDAGSVPTNQPAAFVWSVCALARTAIHSLSSFSLLPPRLAGRTHRGCTHGWSDRAMVCMMPAKALTLCVHSSSVLPHGMSVQHG